MESYRNLTAKNDWWSRRDASESARRLAEFYRALGKGREAAEYLAASSMRC